MESVKQFNGLNGTRVSRQELLQIFHLANNEEQIHVAKKIAAVLMQNSDNHFDIEIVNTAIESIPSSMLNGLQLDDVNEFDSTGLNKAVSADEIYKMVTNIIVDALEEPLDDFEVNWGSDKDGYLIAYNFVSKKPYRSINQLILNPHLISPRKPILENPYFLTFKQVSDLGGKVKKGAKGHVVTYYSFLYSCVFDEIGVDYRTYDKEKFVKFVAESKILQRLGINIPLDAFVDQSSIAFLKYYNVFNGVDVEGIDFDLDKFSLPGKTQKIENHHEKIYTCEAIIEGYPTPKPEFTFGGTSAHFNPGKDIINMPNLKQFKFVQAYYTTFFHEMIHSTGAKNRLDRDLTGSRLSKNPAVYAKYAFEELIAEIGAMFLCSQAGILHYTLKNSLTYVKDWRLGLINALKEDNKFIFKAATQSQKAVDYLLEDVSFDAKPQKLIKKNAAEASKQIVGYMLLDSVSRDLVASKKTLEELKEVFENLGQNEIGKNLEVFVYEIIKKNNKNTQGARVLVDWINNQEKTKEVLPTLKTFEILAEKSKSIEDLTRKILEIKGVPGSVSEEFRKKYGGQKGTREEAVKNLFNKFSKVQKKTKETPVDVENNPKGFAIKPKSVAVATAIKDVLSLPKFKGIKPLPANLLYNKFKTIDGLDDDTTVAIESDYEIGILKNTGKLHYFHEYDNAVSLTPMGVEFITSVKGRLESLRNQKNNLALFDGLKKPAEAKKLNAPAENKPNVEGKPVVSLPAIPIHASKYKTAVDRERENLEPKKLFNLKGDLAKFLGKIEIKPVQSLAITLDSGEGGGKTHTLYNWANEFFEAGYRPIIWSLEEHASSSLSTDKAEKYFGANKAYIPIESENENESSADTIKRMFESVKDFDVIMIDSWAKVMELDKTINFDQDLRKAFNGKLFIVVFQRTSSGEMRGGSKGGFDGDVILKVEVDRDDFRNNYIYNHKNRYNDHMPISELKYSPYHRALQKTEKEVLAEKPKLSFTAIEI